MKFNLPFGTRIEGLRGSGKTTMLLSVVHEEGPARAAVLVPNQSMQQMTMHRYQRLFPDSPMPLFIDITGKIFADIGLVKQRETPGLISESIKRLQDVHHKMLYADEVPWEILNGVGPIRLAVLSYPLPVTTNLGPKTYFTGEDYSDMLRKADAALVPTFQSPEEEQDIWLEPRD